MSAGRPTEAEVDSVLSYGRSGNVREVSVVVERAATLGGGRRLDAPAALGEASSHAESRGGAAVGSPLATPLATPPGVPDAVPAESRVFPTLDDAMRTHITRALLLTNGRIEGRGGAADLLGLNPHTLRGRMRKLQIDWSRFRHLASRP